MRRDSSRWNARFHATVDFDEGTYGTACLYDSGGAEVMCNWNGGWWNGQWSGDAAPWFDQRPAGVYTLRIFWDEGNPGSYLLRREVLWIEQNANGSITAPTAGFGIDRQRSEGAMPLPSPAQGDETIRWDMTSFLIPSEARPLLRDANGNDLGECPRHVVCWVPAGSTAAVVQGQNGGGVNWEITYRYPDREP